MTYIMDYNKIQKDYNQYGYCIIRDVIDPKLAMEVIKHVKWLEKKNPNTRPEAFHHNLLI